MDGDMNGNMNEYIDMNEYMDEYILFTSSAFQFDSFFMFQ